MRVGVLGLGRMGLPIARAVLVAGHPVSAWDPESSRTLLAADAGVTVRSSAREVAASVDVLITVLPGPPEAEEALIGPAGVLEAVRPGGLWLDLTSNNPRVADRIASAAAVRGVEAVGAPMGGGVAAAEAAALGFFVGGTVRAVERVRPLLAALGPGFDHVGRTVGAGHVAKLLANLLWFGQVVAVTEALLLGQSLGLAPAALRDVLRRSAGNSVALDDHLGRLLEGDYLETFGIDRAVEELETLVSLAREAGTPFELSGLVARIHAEALQRFGPVPGELLAAKLLEERAGTTLRRES